MLNAFLAQYLQKFLFCYAVGTLYHLDQFCKQIAVRSPHSENDSEHIRRQVCYKF